MTKWERPEIPLVHSVLHPSDFSEASEEAFAHALALALARRTELSVLHVGPDGATDGVWKNFPGVRSTLVRWGMLDEGSPRSAVADELDIRVKKVALRSDDPVKAILGYLRKKPADLIVLGTRGKAGMPRWLRRSVSEPLMRKSDAMTMFVPAGGRGFVSSETGRFTLKRVLVPVDRVPSPDAAIHFVRRAARVIGHGEVEATLLHIGKAEEMPSLRLPEDPAVRWRTVHRVGDVAGEILRTSEEIEADVVAMVTAGREGILDALRGTTTEQVVRGAVCPVLAIPADWTPQSLGGPPEEG